MRELTERYIGNYQDRTAAIAIVSFATNAFIGIGKLVLGVYLLSPWFIANAAYYLLLCAARGQALKKYRLARQIESARERYDCEFAFYKRGGIFICLTGVAYLLVCLQMYFYGNSIVYSGNVLIYGTATAAFVKMGFAAYGAIITRHLKNPIVSMLKTVSFTDAFVSIVVTESTLLTMKGVENAAIYSAITGMIFSAVFIVRGLLMFAQKKERHQIAGFAELPNQSGPVAEAG